MLSKAVGWLAAGFISLAGAASGQDADLTIFVDGALLEHGGLIVLDAAPSAEAPSAPQTITLTDRFARITLRYPEGASYTFRLRPSPDAAQRPGLDLFTTQALSVGSKTVDGPNGPEEMDSQDIRVLPFAEYGAAEPIERISAAWGETQEFDDVPPANVWGARALPWVFDTFGDRRIVRLICTDQANVSVCTPDPQDALLMEALWWRAIAEGRLERLQDNALSACYDSGGLFGRPSFCDGAPGDGWPVFVPAD
ncbi:MAG: hypothetical protein ACRCS3_01840 [Paracoccaceae bacterium]